MRDDDDELQRLIRGDEQVFTELVRRLGPSLVRVAIGFVGNRATADEVVQETWIAVIAGLASFEGRSSLKNWIFAILANKARTRAVRDSRVVYAGSMTGLDGDDPMVDPARFDARGMWADPPMPWDEITPERIVAGRQVWSHLKEAIDTLPLAQQSVLVLREIEGMEPPEVSAILNISDGNQRVLLHRARSALREFMERLLTAPDEAKASKARRK
ncbi:MAG: RNA polymerase sigma factor [Bauldia sp.]